MTDQTALPDALEALTKEPIQAPAPPRLPQLRAGGTAWHASFLAAVADAFEARRLLILTPFAMIAGLIVYADLPTEPAHGVLLILIVVCALLVAVSPARPRLRRVSALALAAAIGAGLLPLHGTLWGSPMLVYPAYGTYEAVVDEVLSEFDGGRRIVVSQIRALGEARPVDVRRARIIVPAEPQVAPGDRIRADLRLARVPAPILPGAFDSQFHAYFASIGAYGNVVGNFVLVASGEGLHLVRSVDSLRRGIGERIDDTLAGPPAGIARAMLVGDQSGISDDIREVMAASGLAHIYSISGLHLSIVAGGVFFVVRAFMAAFAGLAGHLPAKKLAAFAGIAAALGYLLLAGGVANTPAFRSTLMLVLIFGAVLAGRRALTMRNVAFASLVILLVDPADVFRASFQLSFAAVVVLIGVYELPRPPGEGQPSLVRRGWDLVWTTAWTSLVAGLATLLFAAYHFQQTAPLGVVANVLVLPVLMAVIMPFGVFSVLAMPFGLEQPFLVAMGWGIARMLEIAVLVSGWSTGLEANPLLTPAALVMGLAALAWFAFLASPWRFAGPLLALPVIVLLGFDQRPDVLVADTTQAVAVREGQAMGLMAGRTGSFATDVWSEHFGNEIAPELDDLRCDSLGCIHDGAEFSIALVRTHDAFAEDCARNDLVVTRLPAPQVCRELTEVIDIGDLDRGGVHWLRWNATASGFDVRQAIDDPERPWRIAAP